MSSSKLTLFLIFNFFLFTTLYGQDLLTKVEEDKAIKAFENEDYEKSIELVNRLIDSKKSIDEKYYYLYMRAYSNCELLNYDEAFLDLKKILSIKKSHKGYFWFKGNSNWQMARIYSQLNESKKSHKYYKRALKYVNYSLLYSSIAYQQIQLKKYKKALANLKIALKRDESNAYAHSNKALCYLKLNRIEEAQKSIAKSIFIDSENPYAFKHRAMINIEIGDIENACIDLEKAEELGYSTFSNEVDSSEVDDLLNEYCRDK